MRNRKSRARASRDGACARRANGYGLVEGTTRVALDIPPPAICGGEHYEVSLASAGIENLLLDVTILTA
jgi:hypothetical protein